MLDRLRDALRGLAPLLGVSLVLTAKQLAASYAIYLPEKISILPGSLAAVLVVAPLLALVPERLQLGALLLLDLAVSLVALSDVVHARMFADLASVAALSHAGQLVDVSDSVADALRPIDVLFFADLPVLAWVLSRKAPPRPRLMAAVATAALSAAVIASIVHTDPTRHKQHRGNTRIAGRWGLLTFHGRDAWLALERKLAPKGAPPGRLDELAALIAARRTPPGPLHGVARGRNLLVIQVESLMAFARGRTIGGVPVTPNLDRLAGESLRFGQLFESNGSGLTADADATVNCSLLPLRAGALYVEHGGSDLRCLPRVLAAHGYATAAFQGIRADFWNLNVSYPQVGFARYDHVATYDESGNRLGLGISDEAFLAQTGPKLEALPEPFHAFVVTLTSHHPYDYPGIPKALPLGELAGTKLGAYLDALHYTDRHLGLLLDRLRAGGLLDRSVLVVYGDHRGLGIERNPDVLRLTGVAEDDWVSRVDLDRRIPLFVRLPGGAHAQDVNTLGAQVDVAPTLAALLGVDPGPVPWLGRDLLAPASGRFVPVFDGLAISEELVSWPESAQGDRCFDRRSHAPLPEASCAALAEDAATLLEASADVVRRDLAAALAPRLAERARPEVAMEPR